MTCVKTSTEHGRRLRQRLRDAAEQMDIPEGMLGGQPQLTLDGDLQLLVERHAGIAEYGDQCIRINTRQFTIEISGERLHLVAMDQDSIRIRGHIVGVAYLYQE